MVHWYLAPQWCESKSKSLGRDHCARTRAPSPRPFAPHSGTPPDRAAAARGHFLSHAERAALARRFAATRWSTGRTAGRSSLTQASGSHRGRLRRPGAALEGPQARRRGIVRVAQSSTRPARVLGVQHITHRDRQTRDIVTPGNRSPALHTRVEYVLGRKTSRRRITHRRETERHTHTPATGIAQAHTHAHTAQAQAQATGARAEAADEPQAQPVPASPPAPRAPLSPLNSIFYRVGPFRPRQHESSQVSAARPELVAEGSAGHI